MKGRAVTRHAWITLHSGRTGEKCNFTGRVQNQDDIEID